MIHQYKFEDKNIVLDVCSGAVHLVDDVAYDMIGDFLTLSKQEILKKAQDKYLFSQAAALYHLHP